ncbi:lipopolysaccharide biosynthesis protein [Vibrio sp. HN007]|uniref:lipopolysaccharide biosynthesis protein n=1 Tax=Vibrio iocasae TaxID=3098914 RepID=UPI0035D48288
MNKSMITIVMYSAGLLLTKATSLFMLPFLTHSLSVNEVGRLEFLASITAFAGLITGLAMHEALYRYAGETNNSNERKNIASEFYTIVWLGSLFFFPIIFAITTLTNKSFPDITHTEVLLVALGLLLSAPLSMALSWLRVEDHVTHFVMITVGGCIVQISLIFIAINLHFGPPGVLFAAVITHFMQLSACHMLGYLRFRIPDSKRAKLALTYSLPIAFAGVIAFGLNGAEKWVIAATASLESLASYAISTKLALAMCILVQPFNMWWMGKRFSYLKFQGCEKTTRLTHTGMVWVFVLASNLLFSGPLLINFFLPVEYSDAAAYLLFPLTCALFKELSELVNVGLLYRQQSQRLLSINIRSLVIGGILLVLLWSLSIWGILISLLIAQAYKLYSVYITSQNLYPLPYKLTPLMSLFACYLFFIVLSQQTETDYYRLLLSIAAPLIIVVIALKADLLPTPASSLRAFGLKIWPKRKFISSTVNKGQLKL